VPGTGGLSQRIHSGAAAAAQGGLVSFVVTPANEGEPKIMSPTTSIAVFTVLDLAVIAALAAVCVAPFRLGRRRSGSGPVIELRPDGLEPGRWAA
jgi:hypothetical protein